MNRIEVRKSGAYRAWALLLVVIGLSSCTIRLISDYDDAIDQGITQFERKMDLHLTKAQRGGLAYDPSFFDDIGTDLQVLQTRAAAITNGAVTAAIITLLQAQLTTIETTERTGKGTSSFYSIAQTTIDNNCQQALKLELAKKRN